MEWYLTLILIFGSFIILMASGMPIAFCFMLINIVGFFWLFEGGVGLEQLILSLRASVANFTLMPVMLFVLMGEVMFHSGIAPLMIEALDKWLGRIPGRLSLLAVGSGTLLGALTGNSIASTAILGSVLVPEIEKRGYKKPMSIGPILGSAGIAIMIPPSGLAVLFAAIAQIPVGKVLVAIIIPGLLMALIFTAYIIIRCRLQPSIAPSYRLPPISLSEKIMATLRYVMPIGIIVFLVIGVILLGIATPTEAAATGALGCFLLAAAYRRLNWQVIKKSIGSAVQVNVMVFIIIVGAVAFSQILAFSGATKGLIELTLGLAVAPIVILIGMQLIVFILGMFLELVSIMMITLPLFMPIVNSLGFDPVWFAALTLLNIQLGGITPPFGLSLLVMKGVAPADTTMGDIYRGSLPFVGLNLIAMILVMAFPILALWLPSVMR